ncbi:unannotated protein [freshwater metagenome]|uniref:Unannotated protein n=1 Tax=freshwater metagenome TaxID=449393 RepID=A0A6J7K5T1_9ZZZZ
MTRCSPSSEASWPVIGTLLARPFFARTMAVPPAMVSFATTAPSILPWFWVYICSNTVWASVADHFPVWSPTSL